MVRPTHPNCSGDWSSLAWCPQEFGYCSKWRNERHCRFKSSVWTFEGLFFIFGLISSSTETAPTFLFLYYQDNFFTREEFFYFLRSMGSVANMLPKGGDAIWDHDHFGRANESWSIRLHCSRYIAFFYNFLFFNSFEGDFIAPQIHDKCELINEPSIDDQTREKAVAKGTYSMNEALELAVHFGFFPQKSFFGQVRAIHNAIQRLILFNSHSLN